MKARVSAVDVFHKLLYTALEKKFFLGIRAFIFNGYLNTFVQISQFPQPANKEYRS